MIKKIILSIFLIPSFVLTTHAMAFDYSYSSAQEDEVTLPGQSAPSDETMKEINRRTSPTTKAAPPGGTGIGDVPVGEASVLSLVIVLGVYVVVKRRKLKNL